MCWKLGAPGENTVSLVLEGWMVEIEPRQILPADAVGRCGADTYGSGGHIQLVESYDPTTGRIVIWEQSGGGVLGPTRRVLAAIRPDYKPYRLVGIIDKPAEDEDMRLIRVKATGAIYATTGTHYWHLDQHTYPLSAGAWGKTTWDYEVPTEADMAAYGVPAGSGEVGPHTHTPGGVA
jgi:hypothetical protein